MSQLSHNGTGCCSLLYPERADRHAGFNVCGSVLDSLKKVFIQLLHLHSYKVSKHGA